jgi:hypothetical protein
LSTDSSNLSCKRFNDDKILNPPKFNTLKRKSSLNINKMGGSNRTLNRGDANNSTLKRQNSKLSRNKAHQSEMSLSRQTSLPVNPIAETGSFHSDSLQTQLKPKRDSLNSSRSSNSLFSCSGTTVNNEDDYFTAESSDNDEYGPDGTRYAKNGRSLSNGSYRSLDKTKSKPSLISKNSFMSIVEHDDTLLETNNKAASKESLLTQTLVEDVPGSAGQLDDTQNIEGDETMQSGGAGGSKGFNGEFPTDIDSEMTLKFDIQRPILGLLCVI